MHSYAHTLIGSGLPDFKYLLASEAASGGGEGGGLYGKVVSGRIFFFKVIGLIFSVGGGLSVGSEGPLVHTAACVAYLLLKYCSFLDFDLILDSNSLTKQVFAASAAVGISSAFNAPVGGLLFSVEVTSTFYLVSNYWKSFIAAISGSVACNLFLLSKGNDPLLVLQTANNETTKYQKWELVNFAIIGVCFGYGAFFYLQLHQRIHILFRPLNRKHPLALAGLVAFITAFFVYVTGAYSTESVGVIALVSDVFNDGKIVELQRFANMPPLCGLLISFFIRVTLTLLCTNILVPAG